MVESCCCGWRKVSLVVGGRFPTALLPGNECREHDTYILLLSRATARCSPGTGTSNHARSLRFLGHAGARVVVHGVGFGVGLTLLRLRVVCA